MPSLFFLLNKYSLELSLVANHGRQFNQQMQVVKQGEGTAATKAKVLEAMLRTLKEAPVYHLEGTLPSNFLVAISNYAANESQARDVVQKIQSFLIARGGKIMSCFQGAAARKVNLVLDKAPEAMNEGDYLLLYDLANLFAFKRCQSQLFYKQTAIIESVKKLLKQYPNIKIQVAEDGWLPSIRYELPQEMNDLHFLILIEFFYRNEKPLCYKDPEFINQIIRKKIETKDDGFRNYLAAYLILIKISALCVCWDEASDNSMMEKLDGLLKAAKTQLGDYSPEFIHEPRAYTDICRSPIDLRPFDDRPLNWSQIAKEQFNYANDTNADFDLWYQAIFAKIKDYQTLHSAAALPFVDPSRFAASKRFIEQSDLEVPLIDQMSKWEKQITLEISKEKQKAKEPSLPSPAPISKPSTEASSSILPAPEEKPPEPITSVVEDLAASSLDVPNRVTSSEIEKVIEKPMPSAVEPALEKEKLSQKYQKACPFSVKQRLIDWYDPQIRHTLPLLNKESSLIHDFAWAANEILWQFGLRYARKQDKGNYQPAIAMLCKIEHHFYPKSELFQATLTFDYALGFSENMAITYDPSWQCYHRNLTRKDQQNDMVNEYVQTGKYQFVDYPALPSQSAEIEAPAHLIGTKYPDGSFVEGVKGSIITIRDPKHDQQKFKCRLHFFIVK